MFAGCATTSDKEPLLVEYYYYNTCASCEPEKEFLEDFEKITGISQVTTDIEIKTYNVFSDEGEKAWKKTAKKSGVSEDANFPVLKVGHDIVYISNSASVTNYVDRKAVIVAFISPDCSTCEEAGDSILSKIPERVKINGAEIETQAIVITLNTSEDKELFKKYCTTYHVKSDMQATPIVFVGRTALSGTEEIKKLNEFIELGKALDTKIVTQ